MEEIRFSDMTVEEKRDYATRIGLFNKLSSEEQEVLDDLHSSTGGSSYDATKRKIELIDFYRGTVPKEVISNSSILYVCAGDDIELPLLIGQREIVMNDNEYDLEGPFNDLVSKLEKRRNFQKVDDLEYKFSIVTNGLDKDVTVKMLPGDAFNLDPGKDYSFILEYLGAVKDIFGAKFFLDNLAVGGYLTGDNNNRFRPRDENGLRTDPEALRIEMDRLNRFGLAPCRYGKETVALRKLFSSQPIKNLIAQHQESYQKENMSASWEDYEVVDETVEPYTH